MVFLPVMTLLSIGDQVQQGDYLFHSRFARSIHFASNDRLVSLVDEGIGPGPLNIVFRDFSSEEVTSCRPALRVGLNVVVFGSRRFRFTHNHCYRSNFEVDGWCPSRLCRQLSVFEELLTGTSHPQSLSFLLDSRRLKNFQSGVQRAFSKQILHGVQQVFSGNLLIGIRALKGCGWGLTPSGDDFIAGLLIGLNLLQKMQHGDFQNAIDAIFTASLGDNLFSNTFLDLASRGLLSGRIKDLISALMRGGEGAVRTSTEKLFAVGGTSGADLGTGFFMTVRDEGAADRRWGRPPKGRGSVEPFQRSRAAEIQLKGDAEAFVL